jgi:hypothetical protein
MKLHEGWDTRCSMGWIRTVFGAKEMPAGWRAGGAGFFWLIQVSQMPKVTAQFSFGNLR